ncbi:MAG TPA: hypothetical protein VFN39_11625 [Gemmatimonadaceae bacterium]|nr:hypothetical protein [Gemmatimonadaceae bacterium]
MPQWLRSVLAIVAGFVLIGLLAFGTDGLAHAIRPDIFGPNSSTSNMPYLVIAIIYVGVYATAGCWLAATLAGRRPMFHALLLGVLGLVFNLAAVPGMWSLFPHWYTVVSLILVMPFAWLGGRIRERQLERRGAVATPLAA